MTVPATALANSDAGTRLIAQVPVLKDTQLDSMEPCLKVKAGPEYDWRDS